MPDRDREIRFETASKLGHISEEGNLLVQGVPLNSLLDNRIPPDLVMMTSREPKVTLYPPPCECSMRFARRGSWSYTDAAV